MNKQDEEKAREIQANDVCCVWNGGCPNVRIGAMKMAAWKEKQMIKKALNFLEENIWEYTGLDHYELSKWFKNYMEEN